MSGGGANVPADAPPAAARPGSQLPPVPKGRLLLLVGGGIALLAGLNAALLNLGVPAPVPADSLVALHGLLMLYGFLGTAITLERAVALHSGHGKGTAWAYVSPAASGLAVIATLVLAAGGGPIPRVIPAALWTVAMGTMTVIYLTIARVQTTNFLIIQALGAVAGLIGIMLWGWGYDIPEILPWWTAFIVLTIIGERLELARIAFAGGATENRALIETLFYFLGLVASLLVPEWGYPLMGLALAVLMVDVGMHDIALRTIRTSGLTKFMAAAMLAGYVWALVSAGIWIFMGPVWSGYAYDVSIHALTIGFAMSMIMAHAPIIIPAVARRQVPYSPVMWAVWVLLQLGLLVRVFGAVRSALDQPEAVGAWQYGGAVDVLTIVAFVIMTVTLIIQGSRRIKQGKPA